MKRYLLFAIVTVVSLAADQATKLWAESALQWACPVQRKVGEIAPRIDACAPERARIRLPQPVSRLAASTPAGVSWSLACEGDRPCISGDLRLGDVPSGASAQGKPPRLKVGESLTVTARNAQGAGTVSFSLHRPGPAITVIEGFFDLRWVENPGATFGFLSDSAVRKPVLIAVAILASLFILWMAWRLQPGQRLLSIALALVLSGAIGNLIDRARLSYVIDFLDLHIRDSFRWPTFNVADVAIVVGVALLLIDSIRAWRHDRQTKKKRKATS